MNELGNTPADKDYKPSGISKAEEAALKAFPGRSFIHDRRVFLWGYEKAERDLGLTWEDIKTILQIIITSDWYDFEINGKLWSQEFYEEVLKRFKEAKK